MEKNWDNLKTHYEQEVKGTHLRTLLADEKRNSQLIFEHDKLIFDITHEKLTVKTLDLFQEVCEKSNIFGRISDMFSGKQINKTENRAVLHVALRSQPSDQIEVDGVNVVPDVQEVLKRIQTFSNRVREGAVKGFTNKELKNVVVIGIGGSYLSLQFVYEALRSSPEALKLGEGRKLRFLANVDPIDFSRAIQGLNHEETLFVINSKTFTTAETMLNAKCCRQWLLNSYQSKGGVNIDDAEIAKAVVGAQVCAASTNLSETSQFGLKNENVFGFWDWVGGRYSVWSAVGVLPLSLHFGFQFAHDFLAGGHSMDTLFASSQNVRQNIPLLLGVLGFYRTTIQNYNARAILPYCQALCQFVPHVQQLDMESNGKRVSLSGEELAYETGVVNFGEPGTNGQHSFYQLLHQGRTIPCEFIGFCKSQNPVFLKGEPVANHQELMSNFFSQPDALAFGKSLDELKSEKVPENLLKHQLFPGDRPSSSFLFEELNPFTCGQLLALYQHRTVTEGFLWDLNSFDQWGVELGKVLAKEVRDFFKRNHGAPSTDFAGTQFNSATKTLLNKFMQSK